MSSRTTRSLTPDLSMLGTANVGYLLRKTSKDDIPEAVFENIVADGIKPKKIITLLASSKGSVHFKMHGLKVGSNVQIPYPDLKLDNGVSVEVEIPNNFDTLVLTGVSATVDVEAIMLS